MVGRWLALLLCCGCIWTWLAAAPAQATDQQHARLSQRYKQVIARTSRLLTLGPGRPQSISGLDYARALAGLARFTALLPESEQDRFAHRWVPLASETRDLFSRYDGQAIASYVGQGGIYVPELDRHDPLLQGYLATTFRQVHAVDHVLEADEVLMKLVQTWGTGEPVKLLNYAQQEQYSRGRFYQDGKVTAAAMAGGLRHLDTLWQAYRVVGDEHRRVTRQDRLWRFLGYTLPEAADLARHEDETLAGYWDERGYTFTGDLTADILAGLLVGEDAIIGLYDLAGMKDKAVRAEHRRRTLIGTLLNPIAEDGKRIPWNWVVTPHGEPLDLAAICDLGQALADSQVDPGQRRQIGAQLLEPLLHLAETNMGEGGGVARMANPTGQARFGRASLGATGACLAAAAAYYTAPGHPPLAPARMAWLRRLAGRLLAAWEKAPATSIIIPPPPRAVVHATRPPDWLVLAGLVLALGIVFYLQLRYWPQRWNQAIPPLAALLFFTIFISGFVGGTMKLAEHTSRSEFCASCHVIAPNVNDMFNPKSRSLAAKHYWHEWIKGNTMECYTCHTYGEGVQGIINTKIQGTREVIETAFHLYQEPLRPRQNLNPTCLQCHWRALDPEYNNDPYHVLFQYQLATSRLQCSACHNFHPRPEDVKEKHTRPWQIYRTE